jgi:hypothetical protein
MFIDYPKCVTSWLCYKGMILVKMWIAVHIKIDICVAVNHNKFY